MKLKKFILLLSVGLLFFCVPFSLSAQSSLKNSVSSPEKRKAREAILAKIKKRQSALKAVKERRALKRKNRKMAKAKSKEFKLEKIQIRQAVRQAMEIKEMKSASAFKKSKPRAKGIILAFKDWPLSDEKALILKKLKNSKCKKRYRNTEI